jgi:hypothetical protein
MEAGFPRLRLHQTDSLLRELVSLDGCADGFADEGVVLLGGSFGDGFVEGGVSELAVGLSKVEVLAPHHHSASLVRWFDNHVITGSERAERFKLSHGQVGVFEWFAVQLADGGLAGSNIKIKGRETAAGRGPGGGLAGEGWQI